MLARASSHVRGLALCISIAVIAAGACAPDDRDGEPFVVHVLPFEVVGQMTGAEFVGRAFAGSLAIDLGHARDLEVRETGEGATRILGGTLVREDPGVRAGLRLTDSENRTLWETEVESEIGDLSELATRAARLAAEAMGVPYPDLYEFIGFVTGGPEMSASPKIAGAWDAWRQGDIGAFVERSSELVTEYPDDPSAHAINAWALLFAWDGDPSSETLAPLKERLVSLEAADADSPYHDLMLAYIYRSSGQPDNARVLYTRVLARKDISDAARSWAQRQRSYTYLQTGNTAAALADAQGAVEYDPSSAPAHAALSKALEASGEIDGAIESSRRALALEPLSWRHHQRLALVLSRADAPDEAVAAMSEACRLSESQEACANLAVVMEKCGRTDEARSAADHASTLAGTP
ncbi:MAG: hypothetical protein R3344_07725, partial [Acidobacteriota bacterium]|nr:hypothetical protein [Acidobacteriota bacterium]